MKNIITMAVLAVASISASAVELSAFTNYDNDNLRGVSGVSMQRLQVGGQVGLGNKGAVDASLAIAQVKVPGQSETDRGLELGYSNGLKVGKLGLTGRAAIGRLSESGVDTVRLSATGTYPLTDVVSAVAGVEHIRYDGDAGANRFTVGAKVAVTPATSVRVSFARTNLVGVSNSANGLSLSLTHRY